MFPLIYTHRRIQLQRRGESGGIQQLFDRIAPADDGDQATARLCSSRLSFTYDLKIPPGYYDVAIFPSDVPGGARADQNSLLAEGVLIEDGSDVTVDIQTRDVTVDVTLDGAAITATQAEKRLQGGSAAAIPAACRLATNVAPTSEPRL